MFSKKLFSERISSLRKLSKLSQKQLGDAIGISQDTISRMEKAQRAASIEVLYALADFFDVSLDYLVGRSDNPDRR